MTAFLQCVRNGLAACGNPSPPVGIALSGGADSMALLLGLFAIAENPAEDLRVLHLNHQLRGADSEADAEFVRKTAEELRLPVHLDSVSVADQAARDGTGLEETARSLRYDFLRRAAAEFGLSAVATAHTRDDQAETVLHHILRGTGLSGLCGMPTRRSLGDGVQLIRPLLAVSRAEIEHFLKEAGQEYRTDASNADRRFTRNRIRRELLPWLEAEFNPTVRDALLRLSDQATEAQAALDHLAESLLRRCLKSATERTAVVSRRKLANLPDHAVRECFRGLWKQQGWPRRSLGHAHLSTLCRLTREDGAVSLPDGIRAAAKGGSLEISRE